MKNIFFFIILLCSMFILGCRTYKAEKQSTDTIQKTTDTIWVDRTLPIHDTLYIPITPPHTGNNQCDTLCQQQLQQLLARLNTTKHSGQNNYGIYYDKYRQQLILYQNLQQQLNTYKSHNQQIQTSLYKMQPVPYVPTWIKILAGIGILVVIYICYRISRFFTLKS